MNPLLKTMNEEEKIASLFLMWIARYIPNMSSSAFAAEVIVIQNGLSTNGNIICTHVSISSFQPNTLFDVPF